MSIHPPGIPPQSGELGNEKRTRVPAALLPVLLRFITLARCFSVSDIGHFTDRLRPYRDTVCSVGLIPQRLPFVTSNTAIRVFRHALSLDERRAKFKANQWNRPSDWEAHLGTHGGDMPRPTRRQSTHRGAGAGKSPTKSAHSRTGSHSTSPSRFADLARDLTTVTHTRESTAMTGTTAVVTPAGTVKNAVIAVEQEVSSTVEKVADDAVEVVEKTAEEVAIAAIATSESGSKLWKQAMGRFDTFRTLMRKKKGKQLTEEEMEFNKTQLELVAETDVKEVWFAGCHCGACHSSCFSELVPRTPPHFAMHVHAVTVTSYRHCASVPSSMSMSMLLPSASPLSSARPPEHEC